MSLQNSGVYFRSHGMDVSPMAMTRLYMILICACTYNLYLYIQPISLSCFLTVLRQDQGCRLYDQLIAPLPTFQYISVPRTRSFLANLTCECSRSPPEPARGKVLPSNLASPHALMNSIRSINKNKGEKSWFECVEHGTYIPQMTMRAWYGCQ